MTTGAIDYIRNMGRVEGWFWPAAAYLFVRLDAIQKKRGITGHFFEIGAYHGKSAILLAHLLGAGERLGVCDLFGLPECSPRRSDGNGSVSRDGFEATFRSNFDSHFMDRSSLMVYRGRSSELTSEDVRDCRFLHIDGGHEASDVYGDLLVADRAIRPDGLVVLDDFYNFSWPGVAEGFFRFMRERPGRLLPVAIGFNKGVLCRPEMHAMYRAELGDEDACWAVIPRGPFSLRTVTFCDTPTFVFHVPSYRSPDARRTVLTTLYQHRPRLADRVARLVQYHGSDG